jgi:hypothetical protein
MKQELVWKQADGKQVNLKDLDTDHLQNIAALLVRREDSYKAFTSRYPVPLGPKLHNGQPAQVWLDAIAKILRKRYSKSVIEAENLIWQANSAVSWEQPSVKLPEADFHATKAARREKARVELENAKHILQSHK